MTVRYDGRSVVVVSGIGAEAETCVVDAGFAWREPGDDPAFVVPGSCESPLVVKPKGCVVALGARLRCA